VTCRLESIWSPLEAPRMSDSYHALLQWRR
jgi:hypothetical protein